MSDVKISEILHTAADEHLSANKYCYPFGSKTLFSCDAIRAACRSLMPDYATQLRMEEIIEAGLENLGLQTNGRHEFDNVPRGTKQAARYQWLKFCALLAEEQGV